MKCVTHRCLFWLRFTSPSRQETFSDSKRDKNKPETLFLFTYTPHSLTVKEQKGYVSQVIIQLLPSGGSKLKRKIVSRCTHLLSSSYGLLRHYYTYIHQHALDKGMPALCYMTFFLPLSPFRYSISKFKKYGFCHHNVKNLII